MATYYGIQEDSDGNVLLPVPNGICGIERGASATQSYVKGNLVYVGNRLCQVNSAITVGDVLTIGGNISYTSMANQVHNIKVFVNNNGELVFTDHTGADTVLNFSQIYDLGTGQSFNCTGITNYHNLTDSNFFVNQGNISASRVSPSYDMNSVSANANISISYNASTGILNASMRMSGGDHHKDGQTITWSQAANVHAYCVTNINHIRTL